MNHIDDHDFLKRYRLSEAVYVTQPNMPSLEDYQKFIGKIWENKWLTNNGYFHRALEQKIAEYLEVDHICLFCNGTIALLVALHALRINSGEVITTPFTFPATPHVLYWNGIRPVFCDIDKNTLNMDPNKIEKLINPDTKAIMPVHVYGIPCDVEKIQEIADRHGLHVIYDAAHTFGVRYKNRSLCDYGDISMLSFHATKIFSTGEGGALVVKSEAQKERINFLKNFGITSKETVIGPGINGKMNEFQAAFGLLQLETIDKEISRRAAVVHTYKHMLSDVKGITLLSDSPDVQPNYAYFPILIEPEQYGMTRDDLYLMLEKCNILTRKYFYPLCSTFSCYAALPSSHPDNLPVAHKIADNILCLPLFGSLENETVQLICNIIKKLANETGNKQSD